MRKLLGILIVLAVLAPAGAFAEGAAAEGADAAAEKPAAEAQQPPGQTAQPAEAEPTPAPQAPAIDSHEEKVSYCIGLNIGNGLKRELIEWDADSLFRGIADALAGAKPVLSEAQIGETMTRFQQERMVRSKKAMMDLAEKNAAEGKAFLEENAKKEGVVTLESGLQYTVVNKGEGESPGPDDTVTVNYRGTFMNGREFDSSQRHGQPFTTPVKGVIAGWTEALQLMKVGAKWQLFIPPDLAYQEHGNPPNIGANVALVFEVELLSIEKAPEPAEVAPEQAEGANTE